MLLRNYDNIMAARHMAHFGLLSTDTETFGDGHINIRNPDGSIVQLYPNENWTSLPLQVFAESDNTYYNQIGAGASKLICGGGDIDINGNYGVSYDDYKLAEIFTTAQVVYVPGTQKYERAYNAEDNTWTITISRLFTNATDDSITVKEIGVSSGTYYDYSASKISYALTYRKVLDAPIEVPKGANFALSITKTVSANPNKPTNYDATASVVE